MKTHKSYNKMIGNSLNLIMNFSRYSLLRIAAFVFLISIVYTPSTWANNGEESTFKRVFGVPGVFEKNMVDKVKALPLGKRLAIDTDGDGKNDELWFIDTDVRHTDKRRPILVRVIDEDGDLDEDGPDLDSDIYFADWHADGVIDAVTDYQDNDGDGDLDEMGSYFGEYQKPWIDKNKVYVWWSRDIGDDNMLWYDVDWSYDQKGCQYRSHFSGDEMFCKFLLTKDSDTWLNVFEDPFAFYDPDKDGCSEEAIRICAVGRKVSSLRYSMDVDNDTYGRHIHDYDFSISAIPGKAQINTDNQNSYSFKIRGIPTHPVLKWKQLRKYVTEIPFEKTCFTWDEMNANTEQDVQSDPNFRWEGIINHASKHFPHVGAPSCSSLNKRYEVALHPLAPLTLYYHTSDHRLHLRGACEGWLHVDADLDGTVDARYNYIDEDGDGFFDRREADLDADGQIDFNWRINKKGIREFDLEFEKLSTFWKANLETTLVNSQVFIDAAKSVLSDVDAAPDPIEKFFLKELELWMPTTQLGERMRKTPAGARFYMDLIRDRLFLALSNRFSENAKWNQISIAYENGDYQKAADIITKNISPSVSIPIETFRSFTRRVPLHIDNMGRPQRNDWPITIAVEDIRKIAPDFDFNQCAVVAPERWIDWREIPYQIDEISPTVGSELSFLIDLPEDRSVTYYLYYSPTDAEESTFPLKTGAAEEWIASNIGWESNRGAYRVYGGQFDFFGKKTEQLIFQDIGSKEYHNELEWGIDALHVDDQSGLGGLTLYMGNKSWAVQNPKGKGQVVFTKRILVKGPVRSAIEIVAENVVPDHSELKVRILCLIYAEHQETEIRTTVTGASENVILAPGIIKLKREKTFADSTSGCYGSWGWQEDKIGEIGLGLIVSPNTVVDLRKEGKEYRVRCHCPNNQLRYWVIGDWCRGRKYPVAPNVNNWHQEINNMGDLLLNDVQVKLGQAHEIQ